MQIEGTVTQILDEVSGESARGPWRKREFILETAGKYPKEVCIAQWGDDIDGQLGVGQTVTAHIDIESREYNSRWYTDVRCWKLEHDGAAPKAKPLSEPDGPDFDGPPLPF